MVRTHTLNNRGCRNSTAPGRLQSRARPRVQAWLASGCSGELKSDVKKQRELSFTRVVCWKTTRLSAVSCLPDDPPVPPVQFSDIAHFQTLFTSVWPATDISDVATADGGNTAATWNYGADFGGPTKATWTSGAISKHSGEAEGMFGSFGIVDSAYTAITLCPGTAGSVCRG